MPEAVGVPPTGPASRVAVHMGLLSPSPPHVRSGCTAVGNALALFNDFSSDIYLLVPGHHCTSCAWGFVRHRWQGRPRKRMRERGGVA